MRPVLLTLSNTEPVLSPHTVNSTGWGLWQLLFKRCGASQGQYCSTFERRGLRYLSAFTAEMQGRTVVAVGERTRKAVGLPKHLVHPIVLDGVTYRQIPNPSGEGRWYNDPVCRELAGLLLEELYEEWRTKSCT